MVHLATLTRYLRFGLLSTDGPILAQIVVTRRCNLHCGYCNEYDRASAPVPLAMLKARIAALAQLHTLVVTCTGGEPLLHPDLPELIREIRRHGMRATLITNGYLLTQQWIEALNEAGLQSVQISIDNLTPDRVSAKSLSVLEKKLALLAAHARFAVNVNSVLGVSSERTVDVLAVAERARHYGFSHSVGIVHGSSGAVTPLSEAQYAAYLAMGKLARSLLHWANFVLFQRNLIKGRPNRWKCRAGARFLYVCQDGLVHWCSQQMGYPGIPLSQYTVADIRREFRTQKACSPFCSLSCVHLASCSDGWRGRQTLPDPFASISRKSMDTA